MRANLTELHLTDELSPAGGGDRDLGAICFLTVPDRYKLSGPLPYLYALPHAGTVRTFPEGRADDHEDRAGDHEDTENKNEEVFHF
jgi:hypothetical protein